MYTHPTVQTLHVTTLTSDKNDAATTCVLRPNDNRFMLVDRYLGWGRQLYVWDVVANDTLTIGHMSGRLWNGPPHTHAGTMPWMLVAVVWSNV